MPPDIDLEQVKSFLEQQRWQRAFPSGYTSLDTLCGGLVKNGVSLIAARPGMGRTAFALNLVHQVSQQRNGTILIFAPHINSSELTLYLMGVGTNLKTEAFLNNDLPPEELANKFRDYFAAKQSVISINPDPFITLDDIWEQSSKIRDLQMVVILYANGICKPADFGKTPVVWDDPEDPQRIYQSLQKLARTLDIPVLCTDSLHRSLERRKNKRPLLRDLKRSNLPAEYFDQILFLYRDRYYNPQGETGAELIAAKVAAGTEGTVFFHWNHKTFRLEENNS